jgi:hypothetical protein
MRMGDKLSRTPPGAVILIGIVGSLISVAAVAVAFLLYAHQASDRNADLDRRFSNDHAIQCTFYGDLGSVVITNPNGSAGIQFLQKLAADAKNVHAKYKCGPLPPASVLVPAPTPSP